MAGHGAGFAPPREVVEGIAGGTDGEAAAFEVEGSSNAFVGLQRLSLVQIHLAGESGGLSRAGFEDSSNIREGLGIRAAVGIGVVVGTPRRTGGIVSEADSVES